MPSGLKNVIARLTVLENRLTKLSHHIQFDINRGSISSEVIEVAEMWGKVKDRLQALFLLDQGIDTQEEQLSDKSLSESIKDVIRPRLERDLAEAKKRKTPAETLANKAETFLNKFQLPKKEQPQKEEPKKEQPKPKQGKPVLPPKLKQSVSKRSDIIKSLLDKLEAKVQIGQSQLLRTVVNDFLDGMETDEAGNIKNTLANKRRFAMFDQVYNRFAKDNGLAIVQAIAEGVGKVVDFNQLYFSAFEGPAILAPIFSNVKETISAWLGLTTQGNVQKNGYLDTLIKDPSIKTQIKNLVLKSVVSQAGYFETKKALQQQIEGTPDKLGALQRYYRNFAFDTFSVVDRTASKVYADKLKFNYAIYEGGLIETSRKFCEDHNGKVYSRDEIADFQPTEAIGPGYDPFTDLGGYGCRHHLNWVPDTIAFALRPDLKQKALQ